MKDIFQTLTVVLVSTLLLFGCATEPELSAKLTSISVSPADPSMAAGSTRQLIATGAYSDNTSKDLTASVAWSSSNPSVATISAAGQASAVSSGSTAISASKDGIIGTATLTVTSEGAAQPTRALIMISTAGVLPAGALIGGIDITVSLAPGVSLKSAMNAPETDAGVAVASGVAAANSTILATYSAPTGTLPASARLLVANTNGIGTGEFAQINADIAPGSNPQTADFAVTGFTAKDLNGVEISGLTPGFTADIR